MDESILQRLNTFDLGGEEFGRLDSDSEDICEGLLEHDLSVVARVHGGKKFNVDGFKVAMRRAWRCGSFSLQRMADDMFQIFFGTQDTVDFVLSNGSWSFENTLVLVRSRINISTGPGVVWCKEFFWIHFTGLSRFCYIVDAGLKLAKNFSDCQEFQLHEDKVLGSKFFKFRALVDLSKPLMHICSLTTLNALVHSGLFKYERLPTFCFHCGRIGHRFRDCNTLEIAEIDVKMLGFGPWLGDVDNVASVRLFALQQLLTVSSLHKDGAASESPLTPLLLFWPRTIAVVPWSLLCGQVPIAMVLWCCLLQR